MKVNILKVERHAKLDDVILEALCIAKEEDCVVKFVFNEILVEVGKDDDLVKIRKLYFKKLNEALGLSDDEEENSE
jgi:hypothetical protein